MTTKEDYIYIPLEWFNPNHWISKFDKWLYEMDEQNKEEFRNGITEGVKNILGDWGSALWNWIISITPDLVGYTAIGCGIFMVISPMVGRSILRPLGIFSVVGIAGACIVGSV